MTDPLPEGVEAPPPGVRLMGRVRWALVALMAVAAGGAWLHYARAEHGPSERAGTQYRCPMHPAVVQARPGECPVCGMDLVPASQVKRAAAPPPAGSGAAADHAHGGATPGATTASAAAPGAAPAGRYWCPMHPEVTSDDPEARCAKCGGMKLLPRDGPSAAASGGASPAARSDAPGPSAARPAPGTAPPGLGAIELAPERVQLMGMRTARVERRRLSAELRAAGVVAPTDGALSVVSARFTGWIDEVRVAGTGQRVKRGQVLATATSPELQSAQQVFLNAVGWGEKPAEVGARPAEQLLARYPADAVRKLEALGMSPADIVALASSRKIQHPVLVRAPASGHVARKGAVPGLYVAPGTELFQIADLSTLWVLAEVHESELDRLEVGRRARVRPASSPGEELAGTVELVYPAVNPETHTVQARIAVRNDAGRLRPGVQADVRIDGPAAEGLAVPAGALVDAGDVQYAFVARGGGRFEPRVVRVAARAGETVLVAEGLAEGEEVVTTGNFLVDSESRLQAAVEAFR